MERLPSHEQGVLRVGLPSGEMAARPSSSAAISRCPHILPLDPPPPAQARSTKGSEPPAACPWRRLSARSNSSRTSYVVPAAQPHVGDVMGRDAPERLTIETRHVADGDARPTSLRPGWRGKRFAKRAVIDGPLRLQARTEGRSTSKGGHHVGSEGGYISGVLSVAESQR